MLYDAIIMSGVILAIVDDMFFKSKIRAVAEAVGTEISFPRNKDALFQKAREAKPQLIIVDLHNQKIEPATLATELKADEELRAIPLLGFFSHVETEIGRNALAARSEEHTSELQSLAYLVCRLL